MNRQGVDQFSVCVCVRVSVGVCVCVSMSVWVVCVHCHWWSVRRSDCTKLNMRLICAEIFQRLLKLNGLNATLGAIEWRWSNQTDHLIIVQGFLLQQSLRQLQAQMREREISDKYSKMNKTIIPSPVYRDAP